MVAGEHPHGRVDARLGQVIGDGHARLLFEHVGKVAFADAQMLGDHRDGNIRVGIVRRDVIHRLTHIAGGLRLLLLRRGRGGYGLHPAADPRDGVRQLLIAERLEQIIVRAEEQSAARILKIAVRGQHDAVRRASLLAQQVHHRDAVHLRHADVGDNQFRLEPSRQLEPFFPALRLADDLAPQRRPIDARDNAAANQRLVIHHQYANHAFSLLIGRRTITRQPSPGLERTLRPYASPKCRRKMLSTLNMPKC